MGCDDIGLVVSEDEDFEVDIDVLLLSPDAKVSSLMSVIGDIFIEIL